MQYTQELAEYLRDKYDIPQETLRTWKYRGKIPKKYEDPDYEKMSPLDKGDTILLERIMKALDSEKINIENFMKTCGIHMQKYFDVKREKTNFYKEELKTLKKEINKMLVEMKGYFEKYSETTFNKWASDPRIHIKPTVYDLSDIEIDRIYRIKSGRLALTRELWEKVKNHVEIFLLEITI